MCQTIIEGTGIRQQMGGGDLHVGQMMLPADHQFESRTDWEGLGTVVPRAPDIIRAKGPSTYSNGISLYIEVFISHIITVSYVFLLCVLAA
jgi:hypothetical protein